MAKSKSVYVCSECGAQTPQWMGRCPACGKFGTLVEEIAEPAPAAKKEKRERSAAAARPVPQHQRARATVPGRHDPRRAVRGVDTHGLADAARREDLLVEGGRRRGVGALQTQVVDHGRDRSQGDRHPAPVAGRCLDGPVAGRAPAEEGAPWPS